jgi:predicted metal-dependent phosphoesterase TrpH
LADLFDPSFEPLVAEMIRVRQSREQRAERMVEQLRTGGIDLAWAEVLTALRLVRAAGGVAVELPFWLTRGAVTVSSLTT